MNTFSNVVIMFLVYSIIGWGLEVSLTLFKTKKFNNCGFLTGPYCPIYGIAAVIIMWTLKSYVQNPISVFIYSFMICSIIEYIISLLLEKVIGIRWWDYSKIPFNINGRICLPFSMIFGFLSLIIVYTINPIIISLINFIPPATKTIITIIVIVVMLLDLGFSLLIIKKANKNLDVSDYADEITQISKRRIKNFINLFIKNGQ